MPLTAIDAFGEKGRTDPLFAELGKICKAHKGMWNAEAEKYLLANAKAVRQTENWDPLDGGSQFYVFNMCCVWAKKRPAMAV